MTKNYQIRSQIHPGTGIAYQARVSLHLPLDGFHLAAEYRSEQEDILGDHLYPGWGYRDNNDGFAYRPSHLRADGLAAIEEKVAAEILKLEIQMYRIYTANLERLEPIVLEIDPTVDPAADVELPLTADADCPAWDLGSQADRGLSYGSKILAIWRSQLQPGVRIKLWIDRIAGFAEFVIDRIEPDLQQPDTIVQIGLNPQSDRLDRVPLALIFPVDEKI